jgi:hypothetical protein
MKKYQKKLYIKKRKYIKKDNAAYVIIMITL